MTIRPSFIAAGFLVATIGVSCADAGELISPSSILANRGTHRGATAFSVRTARISSIMGVEPHRAATRPAGRSARAAIRREADAAAGLR